MSTQLNGGNGNSKYSFNKEYGHSYLKSFEKTDVTSETIINTKHTSSGMTYYLDELIYITNDGFNPISIRFYDSFNLTSAMTTITLKRGETLNNLCFRNDKNFQIQLIPQIVVKPKTTGDKISFRALLGQRGNN